MISDYRTSVHSIKWSRMQKPKMAWVLNPGIIGSMSPDVFMFCPMIPAPASPKPRAKRDPIFTIAFSSVWVSYSISTTSSPDLPFLMVFALRKFVFYLMVSAKEWIPQVVILSEAAVIGFSEMILTFSIILSNGSSTSFLESSVKK